MTPEVAIDISRDFFFYSTLLAMPALALSLLLGLIISVFQAATSIQEQTLTFVPRLLALIGLFVVTLPWMLETSVFYTTQLIWKASTMGQ
jgi:flagellar biosynthetic protein FliQ